MESINLKDKLRSYKIKFDLLQRIPCSTDDNMEYEKLKKNGETLPEGIYQYKSSEGSMSGLQFYKVHETDLSESEIDEFLKLKKLSMIRTIKNCVLFFTILAAIGLAAGLIIALSIIS